MSEGKRAGDPLLFGRAGTLEKLHVARLAESDSLDSAFPLWQMERFDVFAADWQGNPHQLRFLDAA